MSTVYVDGFKNTSNEVITVKYTDDAGVKHEQRVDPGSYYTVIDAAGEKLRQQITSDAITDFIAAPTLP